jgi:hypothetical protein
VNLFAAGGLQWCPAIIVNGVHICSMRDEESRNLHVAGGVQRCLIMTFNGVHICSMRDEGSRNLLVLCLMQRCFPPTAGCTHIFTRPAEIRRPNASSWRFFCAAVTRYGSQSLSSRDFSSRAFKPMTSPLSTSFATISWSSVTSDWGRPFIVVISRMIWTRWEISSSCSGVFDGLEVFCRLGVGVAFRVGLEAGVGSSGGLSGSSIIRSSSDIRNVTWQSWLDENH